MKLSEDNPKEGKDGSSFLSGDSRSRTKPKHERNDSQRPLNEVPVTYDPEKGEGKDDFSPDMDITSPDKSQVSPHTKIPLGKVDSKTRDNNFVLKKANESSNTN